MQKLATGQLLTADNQIDTTTGTAKLKAVFDNENEALFPEPVCEYSPGDGEPAQRAGGAFGGIQSGLQGSFVWVVNTDDKGATTAQMQPVKVALAQGQVTILDSGVTPGQKVVVDGADRLRQGAPVTVSQARQGGGGQGSGAGQAPADAQCAQAERQAAPSKAATGSTNIRSSSESESVPAIYSAPGSDLAADGGHSACGRRGYEQLPVSALPEVDYPIIQVLTFYPGAGPEVMASSVTAPLERQFGQMPGLKQMTSVSSGGGSVITLEFNLDENIDVAEQEVQAAINAANSFLPTDLPNPPVYSKVNPADAPIMTLALTSDSLPLDKIEDAADTNLAQKISQVTGVGLVSIAGGQKPSVRIQANPSAAGRLQPEP